MLWSGSSFCLLSRAALPQSLLCLSKDVRDVGFVATGGALPGTLPALRGDCICAVWEHAGLCRPCFLKRSRAGEWHLPPQPSAGLGMWVRGPLPLPLAKFSLPCLTCPSLGDSSHFTQMPKFYIGWGSSSGQALALQPGYLLPIPGLSSSFPVKWLE